MIARYGTAAHVEGLVSKYRRCKRLQERNNALRQHTLRELACFYDDDGSCVIRGRLPAEMGALIQKALKLAMDRDEREQGEERRVQRENWGGQGTWTMPKMPLKPGDEGKVEYGKDPTEEPRPFESFGARRADALAVLAETYLAAAPQSAAGADRYQVVVHVSAETLNSESTQAGVPAETSGKSSVICDNGDLVKITKDKHGAIKRERLTRHWTDWVDYWAVDFDYVSRPEIIRVSVNAGVDGVLSGFEGPQGELEIEFENRHTGSYIFENEWQSFRTRKDRDLELITAEHGYEWPGRYTVAVKVVDILAVTL